MSIAEGIVLCIGNSLLDIVAAVDDQFLSKYGLKPDNAILADEKHFPLYADLEKSYKVVYQAAGSAQNAAISLQVLLNKPRSVTYMGCIGNDEHGNILEREANKSGIISSFQRTSARPTGMCAVLVTNKGKNRSLCANLNAAQLFTVDHIRTPENAKLIKQANLYYTTGFFLDTSVPTVMELANTAKNENKIFSMNISSVFSGRGHKDTWLELLKFIDVLVGNKEEAIALSENVGIGQDDVKEIAKALSKYEKLNTAKQRIVIVTEGSCDVVLANNGEIKTYPTQRIPPEEIVNTNGAGDAFVAGFLAAFVTGKTIDESMANATLQAAAVVRSSAATLPY